LKRAAVWVEVRRHFQARYFYGGEADFSQRL
jgi:hypothetical protein